MKARRRVSSPMWWLGVGDKETEGKSESRTETRRVTSLKPRECIAKKRETEDEFELAQNELLYFLIDLCIPKC